MHVWWNFFKNEKAKGIIKSGIVVTSIEEAGIWSRVHSNYTSIAVAVISI
jgi:hypothetical protein